MNRHDDKTQQAFESCTDAAVPDAREQLISKNQYDDDAWKTTDGCNKANAEVSTKSHDVDSSRPVVSYTIAAVADARKKLI